MSILVMVSVAGRSLQIVEATEPPNFASVPILLHLLSLWQYEKHQKVTPSRWLNKIHTSTSTQEKGLATRLLRHELTPVGNIGFWHSGTEEFDDFERFQELWARDRRRRPQHQAVC